MTETRELVVEHRVNCLFYGRELRFWIESDPAHGGIESGHQASLMLGHAVDSAYLHFGHNTSALPAASDVVKHFLAAARFINSVEWVPGSTPGAVAYRNWP